MEAFEARSPLCEDSFSTVCRPVAALQVKKRRENGPHRGLRRPDSLLPRRLLVSGLFDELGFELHRADAVDPAVDIVIALDQPDVLDLGAYLHHL